MKENCSEKAVFIKKIVARAEAGESKLKLAEECSVTYQTINRWTKDNRYNDKLSVDTITNQVEQRKHRNNISRQLIYIK